MIHRFFVPVASYVMPEWLLTWLGRHWPVRYDPADGWHLWLDVSYYRYVRKDKRKRGNMYDTNDHTF